MTTSVITALLASTIRQGVPILFPAVGETVAERAGVMNIGLEGNMVIGAFTTLLAYQYTQSLFLAILAGALAGCLSAVIIAYIGVSRNQPQAVVGFMFNIFAAGLTSFLYRVLYANSRPKVPLLSSLELPLLSKIPVVGGSIFSMDILAYLAILVSLAAGFVLFSGLLAGLGGAYLVVAITGSFAPDISAGRGFLALAVCLLCGWHPVYSLIGSFGYGFINAFQLHLQAKGVALPYQLLLALPYIVAILSLLLAGRNKRGPKTVGGVFEREGR